MATITKYEGKKGITWQVKVRRQGRTHAGSFPSKKLAEDWARNLENEIVQQKYLPDSQKTSQHTVNELLDIYISRIVSQHSEGTQGTYRKCLEYWRRAIGDTFLPHVTPTLLAECQYYLLNTKGLDAQTVNLYCNSISPAFTLASSPALNWITKNPFSQIKRLREKPGRVPQLTDQQVQNLLEWCDRSQSPHLWLFVRIVLTTGARKQEALTLKWGQLNLKRQTVTFIKTKSRAQRVVPLPSFIVDILKGVYDKRFGEDAGLLNDPTGEYLFPMAGNPRRPASNIHAAFNRARRKAGLSEFRIHDGRHHYASRMILDGGSDILAVSHLLGHANIQETQRYAHLTHTHVASQVEKMASNLF